jgi:hypothetical protein
LQDSFQSKACFRPRLDEIIESGAAGWAQGSYAGYLFGFYVVATSFMPQVIGHRSPFLFMNAIFFGVIITIIPLSFMIVLGLPKQFSYLLAAPFYVFGLFIGAVPCIKYMFHCVMPLLPNPGRLCELEFSEADLGLSAFLLLWLFPTIILWMASIPNNRLAPDAIMNALDIGLRQRNAVGEILEGIGKAGHHFIGSVLGAFFCCVLSCFWFSLCFAFIFVTHLPLTQFYPAATSIEEYIPAARVFGLVSPDVIYRELLADVGHYVWLPVPPRQTVGNLTVLHSHSHSPALGDAQGEIDQLHGEHSADRGALLLLACNVFFWMVFGSPFHWTTVAFMTLAMPVLLICQFAIPSDYILLLTLVLFGGFLFRLGGNAITLRASNAAKARSNKHVVSEIPLLLQPCIVLLELQTAYTGTAGMLLSFVPQLWLVTKILSGPRVRKFIGNVFFNFSLVLVFLIALLCWEWSTEINHVVNVSRVLSASDDNVATASGYGHNVHQEGHHHELSAPAVFA